MKVLITDDSRITLKILERKLVNWGYEVVACLDGASAMQAFQSEEPPQLAIIDWVMPEFDGLELCRWVREQKRDSYTYILLLTAKSRKEDVIQGLSAGADDYISKPFNSQELRARLEIGKRILNLQSELIRSQEELRERATHDALTGMWNRGAVLDTLNRELQRTQREGKALAILLADLDHFKLINDYHGHCIGDVVLREVCQRMQRVIRPYDSIGRYGGEEFLVVLPGCDVLGARNIAERIRADIASSNIQAAKKMISVTVSLGVAVTDEANRFGANALIRAADAALYKSKENGKNCVTVASLGAKSRRVGAELQEQRTGQLEVAHELNGSSKEFQSFLCVQSDRITHDSTNS